MSRTPFQVPGRPGAPWPSHGRSRVVGFPGGVVMHSWHLDRPGAPDVVVVHGLGAASDAQVPVATVLAAHVAVHLPDLPGFGRSDSPTDDLAPPDLADALARWMGVMGLRSASLVGNSAGCQVLIHLAARHPERVDRLVLQGPTIDPRWRTRRAQVARLLLDGLLEHPTLAAVQVRGARQAGVRLLRQGLARCLEDRPEAVLAEVRCPVLVVRGGRDPLVPQRWAEEVAARAPDGHVAVVDGGPHALVYSRPWELAAVAERFLAGGRQTPQRTRADQGVR